MTSLDLNSLFQRELLILKKEIENYPDPKNLWVKAGLIPNSGGHLCWHICGNLQHFVGHVIGNTSYIRDRDSEFNGKPASVQDLIAMIEETADTLNHTLSSLTSADLSRMYPLPYQNESITTGKYLLHLYGHMTYHLGQLNYHRRGAVGN